ncbi:MAG: hypothetical protein ACJ706_04625 [Nitrososphaeraceae archaeon]
MLVAQSYLNDLAEENMPFMYQTSIEGIREVLYQSNDKSVNGFQRLAALKLAKECNEAIFYLVHEWPSVMYVK